MKLGYETFRAFSCTAGASAEDLFAKLAMGYAGAIRNRIERRINHLLGEKHQIKVVSEAKGYIKSLGLSADGFCPEFGRALELLDQEDLVNSAAQFTLGLHQMGFRASWSFDEVTPVYLSFAGYSLLVKSYLKVQAEEHQLTIETRGHDGPKLFEFARIDGDWQQAGRPQRPTIQVLGRHIPVLIGPVSHPANIWFLPTDVPCVSDPQEVTEKIQRGMDIVLEHVPEFGPWIGRSLKRLAVVEGIEDKMDRSRSSAGLPGLVHLSYPTSIISICEAFVHECAHQHYHLLLFVGPMVNGRDETLYPSPLKLAERPLERILLSFHALANIWILYRKLMETQADKELRDGAAGRLLKLEKCLPGLVKILRETDGLTDSGRAIWEPLGEELEKAKGEC